MGREKAKRVRLLHIWEILRRESDEDHPMSSLVILEKLKEGGIDCDRRTLYNDIKILNDFGYEIICTRAKTNNYHVVDRDFDFPEIRILMDAVQAASFITKRKTAILVDKIARLAGSRRAEVLKQNIVEFNSAKGSNEHIYYSVNELAIAINAHKKVSFAYFDYDEKHEKVFRKRGARYLVNPVATVFADDKYYLVCYDDKHGNLSSYRVDRMEGVTVTEDDITETEESKKFDVVRHRRQLFGMYVGETKRVWFEADRSILDPIFDVFGEDMDCKRIGDDKVGFSAEVQMSPMFFSWCSAFGEKLKITGPTNVIKKYIEFMSAAIGNYE